MTDNNKKKPTYTKKTTYRQRLLDLPLSERLAQQLRILPLGNDDAKQNRDLRDMLFPIQQQRNTRTLWQRNSL